MTQQNTLYKLHLQTETNPQGTYYAVINKDNLPVILFQPSAAQPLLPTPNGAGSTLEHFLSNLPDPGLLPPARSHIQDITILDGPEFDALKTSIQVVNKKSLIKFYELDQLQKPDIKNLERVALTAIDTQRTLTKKYTRTVLGNKGPKKMSDPINIMTICKPDTIKGVLDMADRYAGHTMDELLTARETSQKAYQLKEEILQANKIIQSLFESNLFDEAQYIPKE